MAHYKVSPCAVEGSIGVAIFEAEHGGKPGRVSLYDYSFVTKAASGPHCSRTIFGASEVCVNSIQLVIVNVNHTGGAALEFYWYLAFDSLTQ